MFKRILSITYASSAIGIATVFSDGCGMQKGSESYGENNFFLKSLNKNNTLKKPQITTLTWKDSPLMGK